jgi:hypothetical protein
MIIKFIDTKAEHQVEIGRGTQGRGLIRNDVVNGRYVAKRGILCEGVEDITQYKTVLVDGVKTKVEVMPEEMKPDSTWLVADIKLWLDAQRIPYVGNASKTDLLALV